MSNIGKVRRDLEEKESEILGRARKRFIVNAAISIPVLAIGAHSAIKLYELANIHWDAEKSMVLAGCLVATTAVTAGDLIIKGLKSTPGLLSNLPETVRSFAHAKLDETLLADHPFIHDNPFQRIHNIRENLGRNLESTRGMIGAEIWRAVVERDPAITRAFEENGFNTLQDVRAAIDAFQHAVAYVSESAKLTAQPVKRSDLVDGIATVIRQKRLEASTALDKVKMIMSSGAELNSIQNEAQGVMTAMTEARGIRGNKYRLHPGNNEPSP
jgi:hypothetical protein